MPIQMQANIIVALSFERHFFFLCGVQSKYYMYARAELQSIIASYRFVPFRLPCCPLWDVRDAY